MQLSVLLIVGRQQLSTFTQKNCIHCSHLSGSTQQAIKVVFLRPRVLYLFARSSLVSLMQQCDFVLNNTRKPFTIDLRNGQMQKPVNTGTINYKG